MRAASAKAELLPAAPLTLGEALEEILPGVRLRPRSPEHHLQAWFHA
jgi:hypothetical protein